MEEIQFIKLQPADQFKDGKKEQIMLDIPVPRIRTHFNSKWYMKNQEVNLEPSLTIPDEAMTVMEIMQRFASGLPITGGKVPYYNEEGEENPDDFKKLDLSERQQIIEEKMAEIKDIAAEQKKRKDAANEFRLQKLVEERLAAKAKKEDTSNE